MYVPMRPRLSASTHPLFELDSLFEPDNLKGNRGVPYGRLLQFQHHGQGTAIFHKEKKREKEKLEINDLSYCTCSGTILQKIRKTRRNKCEDDISKQSPSFPGSVLFYLKLQYEKVSHNVFINPTIKSFT